MAEFISTHIQSRPMSGLTIPEFKLSRILSTIISVLVLASPAAVSDDSSARAVEALLDKGSETYCQQYTDEMVNYFLTRGTPPDVTMMENAVGYLEDGQWTIDSETLVSNPGADKNEVIVDVRCTWTTPVEDLNGPVELKYKMRVDPETSTIVSVEDAN